MPKISQLKDKIHNHLSIIILFLENITLKTITQALWKIYLLKF